MRRRRLLSALACGVTSGCLTLQESTNTGTADGRGTTGTSGSPGSQRRQGDATPNYATTAAEVTEVQTLSLDVSAIASRGASYAVAARDQIQVREFGSPSPTTTLDGRASNVALALTGSALYVGETGQGDGPSTVRRFDRETGEQRARTRLDGDIERITTLGNALACTTVSESTGGDERYVNRVAVLDPAELTQRWTNAVENSAFPEAATQIGETVHVGFANFLVGFDAADGTIQYRSPITTGYPTAHQGSLVADADRKLRRIDPETLEYDWSTGNEVDGRPVIVGNLVAVPTTDGLLGADVTSGDERWSRKLEDVSGYAPETLGYYGGLFWYGTAAEELYGIVPTTGETAFSTELDVTHLAATTRGVAVSSGNETLEFALATG